jgi:hypothetical protein
MFLTSPIALSSPPLFAPILAIAAGVVVVLAGCGDDAEPPLIRHDVGTTAVHLVDPSRAEPETATPDDHRELMVRAYYPGSADSPVAGYFLDPREGEANAVRIGLPADAFTFLDSASVRDAPVLGDDLPVLVFSPGLDMPPALFTYLVEDLASRGYLVLAIAHPYKTGVVVFPDGRVAEPTELTGPVTERRNALIATWSADQRLVVDWVRRGDHQLSRRADPARIGVLGHSVGGAAAAQTCHDEPSLVACSDMDGSIGDGVDPAAIDRPFLLLRADGPGNQESTLPGFFAGLGGVAYRVQIDGGSHYTFSDLPLLVQQLAAIYPGFTLPGVDLGALSPERSLAIVTDYAAAFFDRHLAGRDAPLLDGPPYPEVVVDRR